MKELKLGRAADVKSGTADVTTLDLMYWRKTNKIAVGETVKVSPLPGEYRDLDHLLALQDFNVIMEFPYGDVFFNAAPSDPTRVATVGFPTTYNGKPFLSATFGGKGSWILDQNCTLRVIGSDTGTWRLANGRDATSKTGVELPSVYGNHAGILANSQSVNLFLKRGQIDNCDDNLLLTAMNGSGIVDLDQMVIEHGGAGDGQSHNIYVHPRLFLMRNSRSRYCKVGQNVKTLAWASILIGGDASDILGVQPAGAEASYPLDLNGQMAYVLGVKIGQGPADSNKSVMCFYQTKRISTGPNVLCVMGCEFDADIAYAGIFFSVDNPYTDPALDYHKAPIIADDPLTVCFDGNRMVYTPGKLNYGTKGGVKLPANAACKVIANNNLLIPRTDPRAVQPFVINIDWAKIRGTELGDMIDGLGPDDYTDAKIQEIYDRVTTLRAGWTPPVVDAPTPPPTAEEDPVVIADLTAQVQQLTADNASLIAERDAANNAITAATAALQTAQDDLAEAIASRQAAEARAANAEGQAVTLTASLEAAMAAELKAVNDLATAVAAVRALNKLAAE